MADTNEKKSSWGNTAGFDTMKKRGGAYGEGSGWENLKKEAASMFGSGSSQAQNGDEGDPEKDATSEALKRKMATFQK